MGVSHLCTNLKMIRGRSIPLKRVVMWEWDSYLGNKTFFLPCEQSVCLHINTAS